MSQITGFSADENLPGQRDMGNWRSCYFPDVEEITLHALRREAETAGVFCYADMGMPVYANDRLAAVHSAEGGEKTLHFPPDVTAVTELYSRRRYSVDSNGEVQYHFAAPETALFELQRDN